MTESRHSTSQFVDPENAARVRRAGELHRERRLDEAAELLERVTREAPQFARGWFLLGFVEGDRGRFEQAVHALERAAIFRIALLKIRQVSEKIREQTVPQQLRRNLFEAAVWILQNHRKSRNLWQPRRS